MKNFYKQKNNQGFTLIETMIAVFVLAIALNGLLGLISSSLFSARYSKNDITANYLIQEAIDYVRNDRDTTAFQKVATGGGWVNFLNKYGYAGSTLCFTAAGCEIEPANIITTNINACTTSHNGNFGTIDCKLFNYDEAATNKSIYTYQSGGVVSNFKRQVTMSMNANNSPDELDVKVTVEWLNGNLVRSRTSRISLLNWQK